MSAGADHANPSRDRNGADPLSDQEVLELEGISRGTFFRRLREGDLRRLPEGAIDPSSLSPRARKARLEGALSAMAPPTSPLSPPSTSLGAGSRGSDSVAQPDLFLPDCVAALSIPEEQKEIVHLRLTLCQEALNGNWRAQGYSRKRNFVYDLAARHDVSGRSVERWLAKYRATVNAARPLGDPRMLLDRKPGPVGGDLTAIEDWAALSLSADYTERKLTKQQCYQRLLSTIHRRQQAWGLRDIYPVPSYGTVCNFLRRLDPLARARREGPDALKAASGHIERRYDDLHSLERVETDEWIADALAYDPKHCGRVGRYYLLTLFDARACYPLVWTLVERSRRPDADKKRLEDAELNLLVTLIREYGVPGLLSSDRGRFRSRIFGGQPSGKMSARFIPGARAASQTVGILDRLGIRRNLPREHNPRGSRLERFHKELANFARTLPGWVGANTDERKMAPGDAQAAEHHEWVRGKRPELKSTPLLSRDELAERINQFMLAWRERPSDGKDMNGLAPATVFANERPLGGFRRVSEEELALATAEHFDELVERGGIVTMPDKRRYYHPLLLLVQGERREVVRLRNDTACVAVLPARKGEEVIFAPLRIAVGCNDSVTLAWASKHQAELRRIISAQYAAPVSEPREPAPSEGEGEGSGFCSAPRPIIPRAADAIPERDFFDSEPRAEASGDFEPALSGEGSVPVEHLAESAAALPSLYDDAEPTLEEM